jgi:hypothetical protein
MSVKILSFSYGKPGVTGKQCAIHQVALERKTIWPGVVERSHRELGNHRLLRISVIVKT